MRILIPILCCAVCCGWATHALSSPTTPELLDVGYSSRPVKQGDQIEQHIRRIIQPTIALPALVPSGGSFTVYIQTAVGPDGQLLSSTDPKDWKVYLISGDPPHPRCRVTSVKVTERLTVLEVKVPVTLARDVYDLRIMALGLDDSQPNAVRILGDTNRDSFRFVVMTDHQLWDPGHRLFGKERNAGQYPGAKSRKNNRGISAQGMAEVALLDPEFVLYTGDLVFGLHYPKEYEQARRLLRQARLPIFAIPGNHDGYAIYTVKLHNKPIKFLKGAMACRNHLSGNMTWAKGWKMLTCIYGDIKGLMYAHLFRDGLAYWRRQLGPTDYAFDFGNLRFVGINTYAGTAQRRHAFSIYMDVMDLHLGAPAVDNYGGYLTAKQLAFVADQAREADQQGRTLVLFGHHDPRGNPSGMRYHSNESFPKDPISSKGFEEWNFDSKVWDSDTTDQRRGETASRNSAIDLLAILARHGGYYLCGHVHRDGRSVYLPGSRLGPHTVRRRLEFIRTTSAASSIKGTSYWGYRLLTVKGNQISGADYAPSAGLASIPAGNLWTAPVEGSDPPETELVSGLPRTTRVVVRWSLPLRDEGYRFKIRPAADMKIALDPDQRVEVLQVADRGQQRTYWLATTAGAAQFPPRPRNLLRYRLRALVARDNQPPEPVIDVEVAGRAPTSRPTAAIDAGVPDDGVVVIAEVKTGEEVLLSAERSRDAEEDRIIATYWQIDDDDVERGSRLTRRFTSPGPRRVSLTLVDEAGARRTVTGIINVQLPPPPRPAPPLGSPGCGGCCAPGITLTGGVSIAILLGLVGTALLRRRSRRRRKVEKH